MRPSEFAKDMGAWCPAGCTYEEPCKQDDHVVEVGCFLQDVEYDGADFHTKSTLDIELVAATAEICQAQCQAEKECKYFLWARHSRGCKMYEPRIVHAARSRALLR